MKTCSKCGELKTAEHWYKNKAMPDGLSNWCKQCLKVYNAAKYLKDPEASKLKGAQYYKANRLKVIARTAAHAKANKEARRIWASNYVKQRIAAEPLYKLASALRSRLHIALRAKQWHKTSKLQEYLGCSLEELRAHLESKFQDGMQWNNHGRWHIDHIIPLASATNEAELYRLCHYSNLQPLWASENIAKSNKIL